MEQYIDQAVDHYRALLTQQLTRAQALEEAPRAIDYTKVDPLVIGACPGDGIGPIIFRESLRVLRHLLAPELETGRVVIQDIDGLTIEHRLDCGQTLPEDVLAQLKNCHVILKGPTTTPQAGTGVANLESANVAMRRELDLFANLRPIKVPELGIDWAFFRENTEGEYALGSCGVEIPGRLTMDFKVTTVAGTRRIARAAFEYARLNGKTRVAIVTKANVLKKTDGMFSAICHQVAKDYPGITAEEWYVDIMSANLINEAIRSQFQVFVLPNLYGDIITDEAAQIQGGVGTAGSANVGDYYAMFEAIHGSAPRMIQEGTGECANPASILKAGEMLLRHIGRSDLAHRLADAMAQMDAQGEKVITGTWEGCTCREYVDHLLLKLA